MQVIQLAARIGHQRQACCRERQRGTSQILAGTRHSIREDRKAAQSQQLTVFDSKVPLLFRLLEATHTASGSWHSNIQFGVQARLKHGT